MASKFLEKLSNNYLELINDEEDFNVIINIGESPNNKIFRAHSPVLRYRSLYFRNKLANTGKDENNIKIIDLKHISIQQFEIIIKYIYGGVVLVRKLETSLIFELMLIAHELLFEELTKYLELHLIESKASWLRLHFTHIYEQSSQNNELLELQNWCNNIIVKYPHKIFNSENFNSLHENALISLIRRDDLQMEEVKIWNYIIKWGIAQNPNLPSEPKNWSQENFHTLKTTLNNFLPLIRYFQISKEDIINNIQPYYQILEENLWKDILKRLNTSNQTVSSKILPPRVILSQNLPSRSTELFSTVINEEHAAEIASWIDKKAYVYSIRNNPYEFKLLVRGSRDGFTAKSFWNLCDKQTNVVVVMKVKGTNEILGGYNPVGWDKPRKILSYSYKECNDSFIFSLKNSNIQNSILSRVTDFGKKKSICCDLKNGPSFNCGLFMKGSFNVLNNCYCWYNSHETYYKRIRNETLYVLDQNVLYPDSCYCYRSSFSVEEYEVFQIYNKNS